MPGDLTARRVWRSDQPGTLHRRAKSRNAILSICWNAAFCFCCWHRSLSPLRNAAQALSCSPSVAEFATERAGLRYRPSGKPLDRQALIVGLQQSVLPDRQMHSAMNAHSPSWRKRQLTPRYHCGLQEAIAWRLATRSRADHISSFAPPARIPPPTALGVPRLRHSRTQISRRLGSSCSFRYSASPVAACCGRDTPPNATDPAPSATRTARPLSGRSPSAFKSSRNKRYGMTVAAQPIRRRDTPALASYRAC